MKFALIGAAGYIAPKHMRAMRDIGGTLSAAMDISDSVGILDSYFPESNFFVEMERFERFLRKNPVDYFVVCTPNYLHDSHIWTGLSLGAKVICEKPVVVSPWNLEPLLGQPVSVIQQLRLCDGFSELTDFADIEIDYVTPRGLWYDVSWKGKESKSGGLIYNIGIHLIDMMCCRYGRPKNIIVYERTDRCVRGRIEYHSANVRFRLSIDGEKRRLIKVNGKPIDLGNFEDLHTESYRRILDGNGFSAEDVFCGIETAHGIKEARCFPMKQAL